MVTRDQIRRAKPTVDSPMSRLIKGEITEKEFQKQVLEKRERQGVPASRPQAAAGS